MNEQPKVSKRITRELERYLNRERVQHRFDPSGQGLARTHPLVVNLELAYLIASEDEKQKEREKRGAESPRDEGKKNKILLEQDAMPRIKSLPKKKIRVQASEIERLAKNAQSTLKSIDADKISTVYRFRQQMIPYEVRHQGKVKQISTNVHAMLNAEEAWRYRKENDEREKVKKYREQQKAKAKEKVAQEAKEREMAKLPAGIRMEIKRQQEKQSKTAVLEKLLEPDRSKTSSPRCSAPIESEDGFADAEESLYEDDFEEEEEGADDERVECSSGKELEMVDGDDMTSEDTISRKTDGTEYEAPIAAVTTANDAGSVSSFPSTTLTSATSRPQSKRSTHQDQEAAELYEDDSFESDNDDADDQSVFMTDVNPGSITGSRNSSRAPSPTKSSGRLHKEDITVTEEKSTSESSWKHGHQDHIGGQRGDNPGSGDVKRLANQLARAVVRNTAEEEGVSYSSMSSIQTDRSKVKVVDVEQAEDEQRNRQMTQEYTRTESVVSLSDRVKMDLAKERDT
ncbi:inner centromere protein A-like [Lytechinus variegatus]|uniref:inner centromere protein A-like n=1 Tax=Lytechinus variegatus TaxID=7654 RepID=UPI001BB0E6B2|nr:inner centromere protein A-like [Lytechinus variegatus]